MSVNRQCKNSFHRRNNSGELDVFEASRYFSSANDCSLFSPNLVGEKRLQGHRAARMSLDMPMMKNPMINSDNLPMKEMSKKWKQPSSPGGRLASFLNSLFSQTASKKKKKKKTKPSGDLDHEEIHGGRKRRSSISHFRITTSDSATVAKTPTKVSYKGLERLSDQKVAENEEFRFINGDHHHVVKINGNCVVNCDGDEEGRSLGFRKFSDVDDGADSDSSSDLFDLPNYDLDLPVYGTTHMDSIRIAAPISSVATV